MWLRVKLTAVFSGLIVFPLVLVLAAVWLGGSEVTRAQAQRDLKGQTQALVATIEGRLALDLRHLKAFAALPVMQDALIADEGRDIARVVNDLKLQYPELGDLFVTDARGAIIAATSNAALGRSLAADEGFRSAASGRTYQSAVGFRDPPDLSAISFSVPVIAAYDRQTVIGTLTGKVDFGALVKAAKAQSVFAADQDVIVIARRIDGRAGFASRFDPALLGAVQGLADGRSSGDGEIAWREATYLVSSAASKGRGLVRDPGFVARAMTPAAPAFAAIDQILLIAGIVAAAAAAAAMVLACAWSTPLVRFGAAMAALARGDAGARAPEIGPRHTFAPLARAFETLRQMRAVHEWLVGRERELQRAKEDAEEALHKKSEHLASLARALKGQLSTIVELSEAINAETLNAASDGHRASHAKDISRSGTQLLAVINDLFDLSEAEAGHSTLREADVDLAALVRESVEVMGDAAHKAKVALACEAGDAAFARVDAQKIKQIMFNLLSNAIKFTPEDGAVRAVLKVDASGRPAIVVQDTGIGMPASLAPMTAAPFGSGEAHTHGRHGAGLGLPLVRELVDMHDGTVEIESESGKGTSVTVTLPAHRLVASDEDEARLTA